MKLKRIIAGMSAGLLAFGMVACAPSTEKPATDNTSAPTAEETDGAATTAKNGTIKMATNAEFPPFEFVTNQGLVDTFDGIDVAIGVEIAKALGKQLEVENMDFEAVLAAIPTDNADFAAAGLTANDERRKNMDFSDTYFNATQYIIVKADNDGIKSAADFTDKRVGALAGYTGEKVCLTLQIGSLESFKKGVDAISALKSNLVDAVVIDSHTAIAMVAKNPDLKIVEDPTVFESESYAIAVKKGNTELLDAINKVLADMKSTGKIDELTAKYVNTEE